MFYNLGMSTQNIQKIINDVTLATQANDFPTTLQEQEFIIYNPKLSKEKDWQYFLDGQKVCELKKESTFKGGINIETLTYGAHPSSYFSLMGKNTTIEVYTTNNIDLTGKFVSLVGYEGEIDKQIFLATSHTLQDFTTQEKDSKPKLLRTKIVLVNIQKWLSDQLDDEEQAPTINFSILVDDEAINNSGVNAIEVFFNKGFALSGIELIKKNADGTKRKLDVKYSTKTQNFEEQKEYSIVPTQWQIGSIDNYGWTTQNDSSNTAKIISANSQLASATQTGASLTDPKKTELGKAFGIISKSISPIQQFLGDKGGLANSTALIASYPESDSAALKMFIQPDGMKEMSFASRENPLKGGIMDLSKFTADYMEINQATGSFGKFGKSMSPSANGEFNNPNVWRALGLNTLNQGGQIPCLAVPRASDDYNDFQINDLKLENFLKFGIPRQRTGGTNLKPPFDFNDWQIYIRSMFFRPDPYTFWNWPLLMPSAMSIYDVKKATSIVYDTSDISQPIEIIDQLVGTLDQIFPTVNNVDNTGKDKKGYWNKTITLEQITKNDFPNKQDVFGGIRMELIEKDIQTGKFIIPDEIHVDAFYSGVIQVDFGNGTLYKFKSEGLLKGTAAKKFTILQLN